MVCVTFSSNQVGERATAIILIKAASATHVIDTVSLKITVVKGDQRFPLGLSATSRPATEPTTRRVSDFFPDAIWPVLEIECPYDPNQVRLAEFGHNGQIAPVYVGPNETHELKRNIPPWR